MSVKLLVRLRETGTRQLGSQAGRLVQLEEDILEMVQGYQQ